MKRVYENPSVYRIIISNTQMGERFDGYNKQLEKILSNLEKKLEEKRQSFPRYDLPAGPACRSVRTDLRNSYDHGREGTGGPTQPPDRGPCPHGGRGSGQSTQPPKTDVGTLARRPTASKATTINPSRKVLMKSSRAQRWVGFRSLVNWAPCGADFSGKFRTNHHVQRQDAVPSSPQLACRRVPVE